MLLVTTPLSQTVPLQIIFLFFVSVKVDELAHFHKESTTLPVLEAVTLILALIFNQNSFQLFFHQELIVVSLDPYIEEAF
jgi:hypothetical protein